MDEILKFVAHPVFIAGLHYAITMFGAMAMYIFAQYKGFNGSVTFLKRIFPNHSDVYYDRLDFAIVVVSGSIIGTIFFSPDNPIEALAAGFGWIGAMNTLVNKAHNVEGED